MIKLVRKRIHFLFKSKHVTVWTLGFERWCSLFTWEANANYKPSRPWKKRQLKKQPFKFLEKCWIKKITCLVVQDIKSFFPSVCLPNYIRKATSIIPISGEFQGCCFSSSCPCNLIVYHTWTQNFYMTSFSQSSEVFLEAFVGSIAAIKWWLIK